MLNPSTDKIAQVSADVKAEVAAEITPQIEANVTAKIEADTPSTCSSFFFLLTFLTRDLQPASAAAG